MTKHGHALATLETDATVSGHDLDAALRKQIGRYKSYRMFSDDLKGNALLTVLDLLKGWKDAYPNERYTNEDLSEILLAAIAREMQTKELGFLD